MNIARILAFCLGITLLGALAASAETYTIDLAQGDGERSVSPGPIDLKIIHRMPGKAYSVKSKVERVIPAFPNPSQAAASITKLVFPPNCQSLRSDTESKLFAATDENGIVKAIAAIHTHTDYASCRSVIDAYIAELTTFSETDLHLDQGEQLTVTIARENGETPKVWTHVYTTGAKGRWILHYGFAFLPNEDDLFFATEGEGENEFLIVPEIDRKDADFEPTVQWSYIPRKHEDKPWMPKFTAGFGADLEDILVFAGASWPIADHVAVFAGLAGHEQQRLKGIYKDDGTEMVMERLTADQLHDDTFGVNVIFGVSFSINPFKKSKDSGSGGGN